MRIGTKLLISLVVPIMVLMVLFGYLDQRRSRRFLRSELEREGRAIALAMRMAVEDALRDRQLEDVLDLAERITAHERILGVRIFDAGGRRIYVSEVLRERPFLDAPVLERLLIHPEPAETRRTVAGEPVVTFFEPLIGETGELLGVIQVLQLEFVIEEDARLARNSVAVLTALMILATGAVVFFVTRSTIGRPVRQLVGSIRQIGAAGLGARVPESYGGELGQLAREFNHMCERLERMQEKLIREQDERRRVEAELQRAEHLASLGRLASGLAHEIGTPLNVISGRTEILLREAPPAEVSAKHLQTISQQIERITRIVQDMLNFGRARERRVGRVELGPVLGRVLEFLEHRLARAEVRVDVELPPDLPTVEGDADQISQVLLNLALNAADAMPAGGTLRVRGRGVADVALGPAVELTLEDEGVGIREEDRDRVFEPFFTTKPAGRGTGLGLAVCYGIMSEHRGTIEIEAAEPRGTRVRLRLPLQRAAVAPSRAGAGDERDG